MHRHNFIYQRHSVLLLLLYCTMLFCPLSITHQLVIMRAISAGIFPEYKVTNKLSTDSEDFIQDDAVGPPVKEMEG